jgi:hypothetical protein
MRRSTVLSLPLLLIFPAPSNLCICPLLDAINV